MISGGSGSNNDGDDEGKKWRLVIARSSNHRINNALLPPMFTADEINMTRLMMTQTQNYENSVIPSIV